MDFTTTPGQRVVHNDEAVLVYDGVPDWVRLPPELGGHQATVKHGVQASCPCGRHDTLVLVLDAQYAGKPLRVAECPSQGYLWHMDGAPSRSRGPLGPVLGVRSPPTHGGHPMTIGPLLACALADAYGAGFEFAQKGYIKKHNRMRGYTPHTKFPRPEGSYTDDTQMALGLAEHLLSGEPWTPGALAHRWVHGFHRDPHTGYALQFYDFLKATHTSEEFLEKIQPHSAKNGGAMRAFLCGFLTTPAEVRDKAMFQASLTHATYDGMRAAAAAALTFHFCYHRVGKRDGELGPFLERWLPGTDWMEGWTPRGEPTGGVPTVQKAIGVLCRCQSLADAIQMAVGLGGDTDTVAAIVAPWAAVCEEVRNAVPPFLYDGLEDGDYGRRYLAKLDEDLLAMFPAGKPAPEVKAARPSPPKAPHNPADDGPLDFLFDE